MLIDGILQASFWETVLFTLVVTHITIASVTIFLHRHQAHRALELNAVVSHFFRLWLWLTTGMVTREWVAIHRKHHAKCETPEDPHSPQIYGIRKVLWQGAELYRAEAENPQTLDTFGKGTPDDWVERNVYSRFKLGGVFVMLGLDVLLFGLAGIAIWGIQMIWIPFWAAGVINGIGHWWGYRHYEVTDASTNVFPVGILIGGEEFHNNHHTFPSSAKLSSRWWEFDIGWFYIRMLELFRLAQVKKVAPKPAFGPRKALVDLDTVSALLTNRFQVMYRFRKDVISRVLRDELRRVDASYHRILKRAQGLLAREETLLDEAAKVKLQSAFQHSEKLETIYRFKQQLQAIWQRSASSHETLVHSLQDWCKRAEATGIRALQDFAQGLTCYSLRTA